ncbi:AAA family ATPase [Bradyrhizobium sp. sBnM-33]|uniref:AAA family ATPase n=1 Tax=Bradyrhizobium sp. sBnM-33 TaxID=2831780 RepID=UPI001BCD2803|nr:AAA family ATPase [Bradyrhizobium sp. sBnM-33]WOH48183.1 AAA family ATPase [Bradyrhizobium sp. sBnM-33]
MAEIQRLDLGHVPFRFGEATERGRNLFDVALDAHRPAVKARVLSEGEQRALGIACFLAEMSRIPGYHGIIVDDPVTSLDHQRLRKVAERLVEEAAAGRQVIVFTHHLIFYQEILAAAAARVPQVPAIVNLIGKSDGRFGLVSENDEPWIAKKVTKRIEALEARLRAVPAGIHRDSEDFRRVAKDFYTDLRETWERLVEEVLLNGVVERFSSGVKTLSLKGVVVEDSDYQVIFANMKRVSELSGHDMAAGRQIPMPDVAEMRRDLNALATYRSEIHRRKNTLANRREALEEPPIARVE